MVQVATLHSSPPPIWSRHRNRRLYAAQQFAFYDQMDWSRKTGEASSSSTRRNAQRARHA